MCKTNYNQVKLIENKCLSQYKRLRIVKSNYKNETIILIVYWPLNELSTILVKQKQLKKQNSFPRKNDIVTVISLIFSIESPSVKRNRDLNKI